MDSLTKQRYQGCLSTPPLWTGSGVSPFQQIELSLQPEPLEESLHFQEGRLGKLVEAFIFRALKKVRSVSWITDTVQIQKDKRTVGEIDALYFEEGVAVHLEVAYKFFLYDTRKTYQQPLAHWIGPNRRDRLVQKLEKLHRKQFPLLHRELTSKYLEQFGIVSANVDQRLCFKAQLFLPYQVREIDIEPLNSDCIAGIYLTFSEMPAFRDCTFYIPKKLDWLLTPTPNVNWLDYTDARALIKKEIESKRSPLVWISQKGGQIIKSFIVFW
jgi:hypothetical protein